MVKINFLLDNPYRFFRKIKSSIRDDVVYAALISAIFSSLNQASIFFGLTPIKLVHSHLETAFIIFISLFIGFLLISVVFALMSFGILNKKNYTNALFILAHSSTPFMILGWIPHAAVKVALLAWSIIFILIGVHIITRKNYKLSFIITLSFLILVAFMSVLSQNFILAPV